MTVTLKYCLGFISEASRCKVSTLGTDNCWCIYFIYLFGFYVAFNTVQVISRWVVPRAEETSTYSSSGFCTVNYRPTASNYQLSHLRPCREPNPGLRGGRPECYHSATVAPNCRCMCGTLWCELGATMALTECFLPHLRHISRITKLYVMLQLLTIFLPNHDISINLYTPIINNVYSFFWFIN